MTPALSLRSGRDYAVSNADYWNSRDPSTPVPPKPERAMPRLRNGPRSSSGSRFKSCRHVTPTGVQSNRHLSAAFR